VLLRGDKKSMLVDVITSSASWSHEHSLLTYEVPAELESEVQPGQLVALPYGERLVEGLIWVLHQKGATSFPTDTPIRPLHAVLDPVPALLPHQIELAQWIAEYYNTPLAQVALMMLPPGLMQRSRMVLRLAEPDSQVPDAIAQATSPRLRALIGLLLSEGEVNVERLKEMLGP
jgi:primosomal protein N' (replication factor Y)